MLTKSAADAYLPVLERVLESAREHDYAGYSKFDALNSPFLARLSGHSSFLRLLITQLVKESPVNLRPLLGVRVSRNPKGIALFARACLSLYERMKDPRYLQEAENLLRWLNDNTSPELDHPAWGYNFVWQNTLFLQDRKEPNVIVTLFVGEAFMHAYRATRMPDYLERARQIAGFILDEVPVLKENEDEAAIAYVLRDVKAVVLNNNMIAGAFLAKVWKETGEQSCRDMADKLVRYTVNRRTEYDAWYYTHPRDKSPIGHDNYHTGGILDALLEYAQETGNDEYDGVYERGLAFYRDNLFERDGAPRWMHDKRYPHDVHGSAQGIISFCKAGSRYPEYIDMAFTVADWAQEHLYREKTADYRYRVGRLFTWNYTLMRWCNAWMSRALGELVVTGNGTTS